MERLLFTSISVEELTSLIQQCIKDELAELDTQKESSSVRDELVTIDDVVRMFRISKVTLHDWKKKGILPYYRISRRVYFKLSEMDALLDSRSYNSKTNN